MNHLKLFFAFPHLAAKMGNQLLFIIVLMCVACDSLAMNIVSSVDRTSLQLNETLTLRVKVNEQGATAPDFSSLHSQFDILNRRQSSQTSIVNGNISATTQWTLILSPKQSGNLIIPSFSLGNVFSDAITIKVLDNTSSQTTQKANEDVYLQTSVDKSRLYVQEQLLLTVRLYYKIQLSGYTPQDLTIDNATLAEVSEKNFQTVEHGTRYNVLEKIYAIHPQANGTMQLPALSWQVEKSTRRFGFGQSTSPYLRVRSKAHTIDVLPIPTESTAKQWLPATALSLQPIWQQSPLMAKVGEPINFSLEIDAEGLSYSQLPNISLSDALSAQNNFTVYADQATTEDILSATGVRGVRTENYAVIPKQVGDFTLPEINLRWWNTATNKEETITIAEQRIVVAKSTLDNQRLPELSVSDADSAITSNKPKETLFWVILSGILGLVTMIFFTLWILAIRQLRHSQALPSKLEDSISSGQDKNLKMIYKEIQTAVDSDNFTQVKYCLIQWASIKSGRKIKSSDDIKQYFPTLSHILALLDQYIYNPNTDKNKRNIDLSTLVTNLKQQRYSPEKKRDNYKDLQPLYKN